LSAAQSRDFGIEKFPGIAIPSRHLSIYFRALLQAILVIADLLYPALVTWCL